MKAKKSQLVFLLISFFSVTCTAYGSSSSWTKSQKPLRVIALTDLHGALEPQVLYTASHEAVEAGGAALLSSYVQILKNADGIPSVIVDAGDLFQGTLISNTVEGRPVVDFYNYLGVNAVAIGNHDFDYGPVGPKATPMDSSDDPRGVLKERIHQAHFPFLSVNLFQDDGSRPEWTHASTLVETGNIKVGIIGFSDLHTPQTTHRKNLVGLTFLDPVNPIIEESKRLRNSGVDYIVLVGHSGGGCEDNSPAQWDNLSSCENGELFRILKQLPPGTIDVAVGGHTHKGIAKNFAGIPVLQPYSNAQAVGWVTVTTQKGQTHSEVGKLASVCGSGVNFKGQLSCSPNAIKKAISVESANFLGKPVHPDPGVVSLLAPDRERVREIKERPLGVKSEGEFTRAYFEENALGNLLSDVLRDYFKDVDIVLLNNGGLRANLKAQDLVYADIFNILPFDNFFAVLQVKGDILLKMMEIGISRKSGGISWSGVTFTADLCKVSSAEVGELALDPNRMYRILTSDFIAQGGSQFDTLSLAPDQIQILDTSPIIREGMVEALKSYRHSFTPSAYFDSKKPRQRIARICEEQVPQ